KWCEQGEETMAQLMILSTRATQEAITESVFSDLLHLHLQKWRYTSEAAELSEDQPQKPASEVVEKAKYELQHIVPESISQNSTDASLVELAAAGNERAFERLVQRYEGLVRRFVYRHVVYTEDAQDIVQFVFLQLYLSLPRL